MRYYWLNGIPEYRHKALMEFFERFRMDRMLRVMDGRYLFEAAKEPYLGFEVVATTLVPVTDRNGLITTKITGAIVKTPGFYVTMTFQETGFAANVRSTAISDDVVFLTADPSADDVRLKVHGAIGREAKTWTEHLE